jgi:hypothetical protein
MAMTDKYLIVCGGTGKSLLKKRQLLGFKAEMQIDVTKELLVDRGDLNFLSVAVDNGQTQKMVISETRKRQSAPTDGDVEYSPFISRPKDLHHLETLDEIMMGDPALDAGLAQSPAVGSLAIRTNAVVSNLDQAIMNMFVRGAIRPAEPPEIWIISSTAGGTGEGTHRFVAARVIHYLQRTHAEMPIKIRLIRVGPLTYRTVQNETTARNTFFSVAADTAFHYHYTAQSKGVSLQWFFADLPDVGIEDDGRVKRAKIIEIACRAIMWDGMREDFDKLFVNYHGIPFVFIRAGFWGGNFDSDRIYFQTLSDLETKLADLVSPDDPSRYLKSADGQVQLPAWEPEKIDLKFLDHGYITRSVVQERWNLPAFKRTDPYQSLLASWRSSIDRLIERERRQGLSSLGVSCSIVRKAGSLDAATHERYHFAIRHDVLENPQQLYDSNWAEALDEVHTTIAWCKYLLEGPNGHDGLREELIAGAEKIRDIFHNWTSRFEADDSRARKLMDGTLLANFVALLAKVSYLEDRLADATAARSLVIANLTPVIEKVAKKKKEQADKLGAKVESPVRSVSLMEILDLERVRTWLYLLVTSTTDDSKFKDNVLRGANGLTETGLRTILGLQPGAKEPEIVQALVDKAGSMQVDESMVESVWWQGLPPPNPTYKFSCRILPEMDSGFKARMTQAARQTDGLRIMYTPIGLIDLNVMAFEVIGSGEEGDAFTAPIHLMTSFLPLVKHSLANWRTDFGAGKPGGQTAIVNAGPIGERLFLDLLQKVLTKEEVAKIGDYYEFLSLDDMKKKQ